MHYFVDGYNFLFQLYEEVDPLRRTREDLIEYLQKQLLALKLNVTIVFDSHLVKGKDFPTRFEHNDIEIIYTPSKQTADGYILEALAWNQHNNLETVVTSDKGLSIQAKALGAKVQSTESFIRKLLKAASSSSKDIKCVNESPNEFKRLLEAFQTNLDESSDSHQS